MTQSENKNKNPYEMLIYNKSYVYSLKINKSIYDKFSVELNDLVSFITVFT